MQNCILDFPDVRIVFPRPKLFFVSTSLDTSGCDWLV